MRTGPSGGGVPGGGVLLYCIGPLLWGVGRTGVGRRGMPYKPCIGCNTLMYAVKGVSRCEACARPSARERGYTTEWDAISRAVVAAAGACARCGHTGDRANPLTTDHVVSKRDEGSDDIGNLRCLCRRCNAIKGGNSE